MCDFLSHRGPDDAGCYVDGPVGLANRRLAIVDPSSAGHMPMSVDDRYHITHNGEVYNYRGLRDELSHLGYVFRTNTDTEVIVAAYREWGANCVERLRGMFAFAIWDATERNLLLARDRVGKKPLHYLVDSDGIAFASEPKALFGDPGFRATPDLVSLSHYLTFQYVPAPLSAYQGVRKLPPAHRMAVRQGHISTERYWRLAHEPKLNVSEDEAAREVVDRLREATRLRLISDVPLGAFLSGGIDSSTIVALMSQLVAAPVKTFSIGFEESEYDERIFAREIARRYGTDHHEYVVRPDALTILPKLAWYFDEPFGDSSAIPTFYLAELTKQHVTVALNGDGGDENFGGYDRYVANAIADRYIPRAAGRALAVAASVIRPGGHHKSVRTRARRFLGALAETKPRRYARWVTNFDPTVMAQLCTADFLSAAASEPLASISEWYAEADTKNTIDATLYVDVNTYLPGDLLTKMDTATMAHGLEARSPFLDHEFMEFVARLPASFKIRRTATKYILRRAAKELLPKAILRRGKMGFGVPIGRWFRSELRSSVREILLDERARSRGYFRPEFVARLIDEHARGVRAWDQHLWSLLMLEMWHRTYVDGRPQPVAKPGLPTAVSVEGHQGTPGSSDAATVPLDSARESG